MVDEDFDPSGISSIAAARKSSRGIAGSRAACTAIIVEYHEYILALDGSHYGRQRNRGNHRQVPVNRIQRLALSSSPQHASFIALMCGISKVKIPSWFPHERRADAERL